MEQGHGTAAKLAALRASIARIGQPAKAAGAVITFEVPAIDGCLPGGGLALGALHEVASGGADIEHGAARDAAERWHSGASAGSGPVGSGTAGSIRPGP
jgi:hypothetical protein